MSHKIHIILLTMFICTSYNTFCQTSWEIDKEKDGIVVYTKLEKNSDFKSFKAIVLVDASIDEVVRLLKDADSYTEWYGYTKTSKILKQDKGIQYNYVETVFPWPYKNRDMVYRMSISASDIDKVLISLKGMPDYISQKKGIVRMKKAEGNILLRRVDSNTEITYTFHSEPGDAIPAWLANNSIGELPFKTLTGLRGVLMKGNANRR